MSSAENDPRELVENLLKKDPFSQWMEIEILEATTGTCTVQCTVNNEMLNGYEVAHGGILFSLADTALAFSAATLGRTALALDNSISFTKKARLGDILIAESSAVNTTYRTGLFDVRIRNQDNETVAFMKGTVYRTD